MKRKRRSLGLIDEPCLMHKCACVMQMVKNTNSNKACIFPLID